MLHKKCTWPFNRNILCRFCDSCRSSCRHSPNTAFSLIFQFFKAFSYQILPICFHSFTSWFQDFSLPKTLRSHVNHVSFFFNFKSKLICHCREGWWDIVTASGLIRWFLCCSPTPILSRTLIDTNIQLSDRVQPTTSHHCKIRPSLSLLEQPTIPFSSLCCQRRSLNCLNHQ